MINQAGYPSHYIRREAATSAVINSAISVGLFFAMFELSRPIPVHGWGNFAADFLPQSFAVVFFGTFVPSLLTRAKLLGGRITSANPSPGPLQIAVRSALLGGAATVLLGSSVAGLLLLLGPETLLPQWALISKLIFGGVVGGSATCLALTKMLR